MSSHRRHLGALYLRVDRPPPPFPFLSSPGPFPFPLTQSFVTYANAGRLGMSGRASTRKQLVGFSSRITTDDNIYIPVVEYLIIHGWHPAFRVARVACSWSVALPFLASLSKPTCLWRTQCAFPCRYHVCQVALVHPELSLVPMPVRSSA